MAANSRLTWVDALRLTAGLSMVGLHSTADPTGQPWTNYEVHERIGPIVIRSFLYIARTELFIIISIFLLMMALDKRPRSYSTVIKEQSSRLLIPFFFWTFFYAAYNLIKASQFGYMDASLTNLGDVKNWIGFLLLGDVKYHMHFIPTLFGILVFFPLFKVAQKYPVLGLSVFAFLLIKLELDGFIFSTLWGTETLPYAVRIAKILTYVGYGMFAASVYGIFKIARPNVLKDFIQFAFYFAALLLILKAVGGYKTIVTGEYPYNYKAGYWADFLMPAVLFAVCFLMSTKNWPVVLSTLAPYSFGIYLCHPMFLDLVEVALVDTSLSPTMQVLTKLCLVIPSTCILVFALRRIRPLAWTIGLGAHPFRFNKTVQISG